MSESGTDYGGPGTFVLVGCGAAKADEPCEARDLYTSTYFQKKREFAEAATKWARKYHERRNAWAILSAEHAILPHGHEVEPYDTTVDDLDDGQLDQWADRAQSSLETWLRCPFTSEDPKDSPCKQFIVLAGKRYIEPLRERDAFDGSKLGLPAPPEFPLQEHDLGGIGEQMAWLDERTERIAAGPAQRSELSAFGGGYERDRALWQVDRPEINIEETEQAALDAFEDVDSAHVSTEQQSLQIPMADGGNSRDVDTATGQEDNRGDH